MYDGTAPTNRRLPAVCILCDLITVGLPTKHTAILLTVLYINIYSYNAISSPHDFLVWCPHV